MVYNTNFVRPAHSFLQVRIKNAPTECDVQCSVVFSSPQLIVYVRVPYKTKVAYLGNKDTQ